MKLSRIFFAALLSFAAACTHAHASNGRYVIYVHGKAVEDGGRRPMTRFGVYEYDAILDAFRHEHFRVLSTQREKDADRSKAADEVVSQVRGLLKSGVPPSHITIVGASKGAVITMIASTRLQNRDLRYVILGNCNDWVLENIDIRLSGQVLSIYEETDEFGHSCAPIFARAGSGLQSHDEVHLQLGINHAFLYTPRDEWLRPAVKWARDGAL